MGRTTLALPPIIGPGNAEHGTIWHTVTMIILKMIA